MSSSSTSVSESLSSDSLTVAGSKPAFVVSKLWVGVAALALAAVAGYSWVQSRNETLSSQGKDALFLARKLEEKEIGTAKGAATEKFDVDARMPGTVKAYRDLVAQFPSQPAGFEARVILGGLYLTHGQPAKAIPLFEDASRAAPSSLEKAIALSALGYSQEALGNQSAEALASFEKALSAAGKENTALRGDVLLSIGRVHAGARDTAKARQAYQRVISELPGTEYAKAAELAQLQLQ
jgi:tetratricopeptide (TPR) repeat protein